MELGGEGLNLHEQEGEELDHTGRESLTAWTRKGGAGLHVVKEEGLAHVAKKGGAGLHETGLSRW